MTTFNTEENNKEMEAKIDEVLERLRPFLAREGGDIRLDHFDSETGYCYVEMTGACNGCYMAESDVSDSVEVLLMDEIPEIKKVELVKSENSGPSLDDLLARLREEEKANQELEEYNRTHKE
jgi:Fe-S cluster biogenesis protein NfuA